MPRKTVMTPTFVAEACALMRKSGVSGPMAARKMGCSLSTIMRCTGGKRAAEMGKRSAYLDKLITPHTRAARKQARKAKNRTAQRQKSRAAPLTPTGKRRKTRGKAA